MFTHLHGHGTYSMLEGIGSVSSIVKKIHELGMKSVAITDYYGIYGMIDFYRTAKDLDINAIVGVELGLVDKISTYHSNEEAGNIVLLAENKQGYDNILSLVSFAHSHLLNHKPCIDFSILEKYSGGLFAFMGGKGSVLGKMLKDGHKQDDLISYVNKIIEIFGKDRFFCEIVAQDYKKEPDLKTINDGIDKLATDLKLGCIVSNNFHYVEESDKEAFELALAIKDGYKLYEEQRRKVGGDYHIFSEDELMDILIKNGMDQKKIDTLIQTTQELAEKCSLDLDLYQSLFPLYEPPKEIKSLYDDKKAGLVEEI